MSDKEAELTEEDLDEQGWERLTASLEEEIAEAGNQRGLGEEQRAIITEMMLEPLRRGAQEDPGVLTLYLVGFLMVGWVRLGFLPSQLAPFCREPGLELTATFCRLLPTLRDSDRLSPSGASQFWDGLICNATRNWEDAKTAFDLCLEDPSLPLWMRVSALQLKDWHHVRAQEYDAARETLRRLRDNLTVSKSKADYLMG